MTNFLIRLLITSLAVAFAAWLLPGIILSGFGSAILVALALALLNQIVKPLLIILTIPATILTFGLFLLVINALIIMLADWMVLGFEVQNFWYALLFSIVLTFITSILDSFRDKPKQERRD